MQEVTVKPHRLYRFTFRVKTEGRAPVELNVPATSDWRQFAVGFNSLSAESVNIYTSVWGGKAGRFWLDDLRMEEIGLANVLRRPGTPLSVRARRPAPCTRRAGTTPRSAPARRTRPAGSAT